jgi:hypothetical protein
MHEHSSWHSCYINDRGTDIQTPDGFACALDCCLAKLIKRVPEQQWQQLKRQWEASLLYALPTATTVAVVRRCTVGENIARIWKRAGSNHRVETELDRVLPAYSEFIRLFGANTDKPPVLIIDEASMLMAWSGKYDREVRYLMGFFKFLCSRNELAVVLATSEYSFQPWLNNGKPCMCTFMCILADIA